MESKKREQIYDHVIALDVFRPYVLDEAGELGRDRMLSMYGDPTSVALGIRKKDEITAGVSFLIRAKKVSQGTFYLSHADSEEDTLREVDAFTAVMNDNPDMEIVSKVRAALPKKDEKAGFIYKIAPKITKKAVAEEPKPIAEWLGSTLDEFAEELDDEQLEQEAEKYKGDGGQDALTKLGGRLVNQKVRVYTPARGLAGGELFGPVKVKRLLGVKPDQIIDYKALVGDASDNYPGVPGVGPKTAVQLLKKYGNLKTIYQSLDKIKPAVAKKLVNGRESARVSKKLAKIVRDAPVKLKLRACRLDDYNQSEVIELFEKLEFKSLVKQLPGVKKSERQMSLI